MVSAPQGEIIKQQIDILDHGYSWKREQDTRETFRIYGKIIKKAFHQLGRDAVRIMRFYFVAAFSFPENGSFHVLQLAEILTTKCGYSFNNRESKKRLLKQLRSAPAFFRETKEGYFTFTSKRRFLGFKRASEGFITADFSILHKSNNKDFTDLLLKADAAGQQTATENICNQTGYKRSRIFSGLQGLKRYNITETIGIYKTLKEAQKIERTLYFQQGVLSRIVKNSKGDFELKVILGNSFVQLSDSDAIRNGIREEAKAEIRSSLNNCTLRIAPSCQVKDKATRQTNVFRIKDRTLTPYINAITGAKVYYLNAEFINDEARLSFMKRVKCA